MDVNIQDTVSTSVSSVSTVQLHTGSPNPQFHDVSVVSHPKVSSCPSSPCSNSNDPSSPPDSPSLTDPGSVSSLPSVSSSFFFSSAAASPPLHPHGQGNRKISNTYPSQHEHDQQSTKDLIIPSLTLPAALRRPTAYGQALGDVRLVVVSLSWRSQLEDEVATVNANQTVADTELTLKSLLEDNPDVVDVGVWQEYHLPPCQGDPENSSAPPGICDTCDQTTYSKILRASTDWIEHRDEYGLEKFEPARNIEIIHVNVALPDSHSNKPYIFNPGSSIDVIRILTSIITRPFYSLSTILHPDLPPYTSALVHSLISSPGSPLFSGLVILSCRSLTVINELSQLLPPDEQKQRVTERTIFDSLGAYVPLITVPESSTLFRQAHKLPLSPISSRHKHGVHHLHLSSIFHPSTLQSLRAEAADKFVRWYEVERVVTDMGLKLHEKSGTIFNVNDYSEGTELNLATAVPAAATDQEEGGMEEEITLFGTIQSCRLSSSHAHVIPGAHGRQYSEADQQWERRIQLWDTELSLDVAHTLQRRRRSSTVHALPPSSHALEVQDDIGGEPMPQSPACSLYYPPSIAFDPLHLPSLLWFSVSLLGPLKRNIFSRIGRMWYIWRATNPASSVSSFEVDDMDDAHGELTKCCESEIDTKIHTDWSVSQGKTGISRWVIGIVGMVGVGVGLLVGVGLG